MNQYLIWLLAYSGILILLGFLLSRKVHKAADFLVAGRSLGSGLVFSTLLAANIGAGSTVGASGLGYQYGWPAWWWVGSAGLGSLILANTVGPRIWRLAHSQNYHTLGDFLEQRYSRGVRALIAVVLWIGSLGLLAAQLIAISIVFQVVAGVPPWFGSVLGGLVMICYFAAGGLLSAAWINMLQLVVLLAGFLLALPYAINFAGGWDRITTMLSARLGAKSAGYLSPAGLGVKGSLYYLALLLPSFVVSPGLIQKVYGARSPRAAIIGVNLNGFALLLFAAVPPALGMIAAALFPGLADPQMAMFKVMTGCLPTWLAILGLAAIFSAEVSTCDAVLFMISTSITVDMYKAVMKPRASERDLLRIGRWSSVGAGCLGVLLAIRVPSIISSLTLFYSLVSVALFVPVLAGLYSRRPTAQAALAAIAVSVPITLILHYWVGDTVLGFLNPFVVGIAASFIVLFSIAYLSTDVTGRHNRV